MLKKRLNRSAAVDPLAARLRQLVLHGTLPASALSAVQQERLAPLFDAEVLTQERSGAGRRIVVNNMDALVSFSTGLFPSGLDGILCDTALPRAAGVRTLRDAKTSRTTCAEPVLLRGFGNAELVSADKRLPVAMLSELAGMAALRLEEPFAWGFSGSVAIAENLEFFLSIEYAGISCDIVIYAGGRLSARVVSWLSSSLMSGCSVLHCGDYDPAGLQEFLRLRQQLGDRASLHVPENLELLVKKYGKPDLLKDQSHLMESVRSCGVDDVLKVLRIMEEYGMGLEQEVLLCGAT